MRSLLLLIPLALPAHASDGWTRYATPESAGFSGDGIARARELAEEIDSAAVLVVYRGHVLCAWGDVERRFKCHSSRKSLLSALIGVHVAEGRIDLEKTLAELGIDDQESLSDTEKSAHVVDLLRARSGVYHPAAHLRAGDRDACLRGIRTPNRQEPGRRARARALRGDGDALLRARVRARRRVPGRWRGRSPDPRTVAGA